MEMMRDRIRNWAIDKILQGVDKTLGPQPVKPKPSYYDQHIERINKRLAELEQIERETQTATEQAQPEKPSELALVHKETTESRAATSPAQGEELSAVMPGEACIPCVNNHFSTCAGLISDEGMRMALRGSNADEVIRRLNRCLDQLNAMEREDLAPEKVARLSPPEKEIAIYAQKESADIRHQIESIKTLDDLEPVAVHIIQARDEIGKRYFSLRLQPKPELTLEEAKKLAAEEAARKVEERWH